MTNVEQVPPGAADYPVGVPARGLRIVMLTTDERIDRRIVAEAATLCRTGFDVYILAGGLGTEEQFGYVDGVPLERLPGTSAAGSAGVARAVATPKLGRLVIGALPFARLARTYAGTLTSRLGGRRGRVSPRTLGAFDRPYFDRARFYRPDIVHVHDLPLLRAGVAAADACGARLVYDMHEFYPEQRTLKVSERARARLIERELVRRADLRITVNPPLAEAISQRYDGLGIDVVQNAAETPLGFTGARPDRFREELGLPADRRILLVQGWLGPHRNLENLVAGMAHVRGPVVLVVMGYGDLRAELEQIAGDLELNEKVAFVDAKPQGELLWWTASADVGLIPYPPGVDVNTRYSSPNKLYEYIAADLPILANELPFVREVVAGNGFGVTATLDTPEQVARAIDAFPYDRLPEFRENLRARGVAFTWDHEERRLLEAYDRMLAGVQT